MNATIYGQGRAASLTPPAWVYTDDARHRRRSYVIPRTESQGMQVTRPTFRTVASTYRDLRRAGLPVHRARSIVFTLLWAGAQCSHFTVDGRPTWAALDVLAGNVGPYTHIGGKR